MTSKSDFHDKEYRQAYADSFLDTWIATQLRVLREQRELTQQGLADLVGMKQSRISTMEDVNYSNWSIKTLKRLAHAFDVPLLVSWGTYGDVLRLSDDFTRDALRREAFDDDPEFTGEDDAIEVRSVQTTVSASVTNVIDGSSRFKQVDAKIA